MGFDGRPAAVKNFAAYSLIRLGVDHIDIYRPARLDPQVPIEDTIGAISELVTSGHVRSIGLSEVGIDTIRRAHAVHPICDLQIEYSLISRDPEKFSRSRSAWNRCDGLRSAFTRIAERISATGFRGFSFLPAALPWRKPRAEPARCWGASQNRVGKGNESSQLAIAWVLAKGSSIVPVIGARKRVQLAESLGALRFELSRTTSCALKGPFPQLRLQGLVMTNIK